MLKMEKDVLPGMPTEKSTIVTACTCICLCASDTCQVSGGGRGGGGGGGGGVVHVVTMRCFFRNHNQVSLLGWPQALTDRYHTVSMTKASVSGSVCRPLWPKTCRCWKTARPTPHSVLSLMETNLVIITTITKQ